jgi:hypothetical protein
MEFSFSQMYLKPRQLEKFWLKRIVATFEYDCRNGCSYWRKNKNPADRVIARLVKARRVVDVVQYWD